MTFTPPAKASSAILIPLAGPGMGNVTLAADAGPMLIGRIDHCHIKLAADSVSRHHARMGYDGSRWRVADLDSRWGTFVNGVRIASQREVPLGEGDLLCISPWTFRFSLEHVAHAGVLDGALESADDSADASRKVHTLNFETLPSLGDEMLKLLLDSAEGIHAAADERQVAEVLLKKACDGSGLPNAAVLKPAGTDWRFEIVASRTAAGSEKIAYSRTLLKAASGGAVAELSVASMPIEASKSIVSLGLRSALCVPLMLGQTVAAYLYLDSRGDPNSSIRLPLRPNASAFCSALGRIASLALANLKRIEMDRRSEELRADLTAAAAAQQWILPKPTGNFGRFSHTGQSRPGEYVGGDFYDVIPLDDHRLAIALGDVSGHGVAASVLMTASAGFLHAVLLETADPASAVNRLNEFICPRKPVDRFLTLWVGVLDLRKNLLRYVDAGHGWAFMSEEGGGLRQLESAGQIPIGVDEDFCFRAITAPLPSTGRVLLVSDGIIEQFAPPTDAGRPVSFGLDGLARIARETPADADLVQALFDAVVNYAGREQLSDDATGVVVKW